MISKSKIRKMFKKFARALKHNNNIRRLALFVLVFAIIGSLILIASHAASPSANIEPEKGSLNGSAESSTDPGASGGGYVRFGATNRTRLGIDINSLPDNPPVSLATAYNLMSYMGFGLARTGPTFDKYTEVNPGNFDDNLVQAKRVNMKIMVTLAYAYGPLGSSGCVGGKCVPADPQGWATYAGKLVAHWKATNPGIVTAVEVWNEANNPQFWKPVSPTAYTDLLKRTYTAIKAADSSVKVIASGPAPGGGNRLADSTTDPTNPATFYKQMYAAGAKGFFDAGANHPYDTYYKTANVNGGGPRNNFWIRKVMDANGDQAKQIWATESGTVSCTHGTGGNAPFTEAERSLRLALDLNDFWHGIHNQDSVSNNYGGTVNTASPNGDLNAGPYFIFKLYKTEGDSGDGLIYNTNAWMKNPPAGEGPDGTAEASCKTQPDYYIPGSVSGVAGMLNTISNFSNNLQRVP